jgi:peptidoglycan/xylan/chitin deacetylase (PgdA/CDA1 family)
MLSRCGFCFISLASLLRALDEGRKLPRRAVLVTFDDAYADLLSAGCPVLSERRIPAVAFAVTDHLGDTNEWDRPLGAAVLPLLDADGLRAIAARGIVVGSHGATHRPLVGLTAPELEQELIGSAERLRLLGLPKPETVSYAHGEWSPEVAAAARRAGYAGAFTVIPDVVRASTERYALPRVEVYAGDTPIKLVIKLAIAGWPDPWRRRLLRLLGMTLGA